jgi:hypothetical protein
LIGFVFVFKYNYKTHFSNFYDHKSWPDSSKTIEHEFVLLLEKTANQNNATTKYFVPIGQFWNMSTKIILESFLTVSPKLLNAACSLGKQQVPIVQSFGLNPGGTSVNQPICIETRNFEKKIQLFLDYDIFHS